MGSERIQCDHRLVEINRVRTIKHPMPLYDRAIRTLKNGKVAGPNGIPAEALKADIDTATDILHNLFAKIWDEEKVPADLREGLVLKLPKKGDLRDCSNYRGIMLLSVPGKVLNRVILDRSGLSAKGSTGWISQKQILC